MKVRKLNEHGLVAFRNFIDDLSNGIEQNTPLYLLEDNGSSEEIEADIDAAAKPFSSRYEMGVYTAELLKGHSVQQYIGDVGFWSWFALYWFDQLCPLRSNGMRSKPSKYYNYVLSKDYRHRPRHAVYMTWQLVNRYGENARFLLSKEMSTRGELIEQIMARQYFLGYEGVMNVASKLYSDNEKKSFKKGSTGRRAQGCVARFVSWLQQLELTYDLYSIAGEELEELLPTEFNRFRKPL